MLTMFFLFMFVFGIICINFVGDVVGFGEKLFGAPLTLLQLPEHCQLFALPAETLRSSQAVIVSHDNEQSDCPQIN